MIRNCDGTPYQLKPTLQQYNPGSRDLALINQIDAESIRIGGSPILYFEMLLQKQTIDPLYREDRGKIWSQCPVELYATYEPIGSQNYMNMFGMDSSDQLKFELNLKATYKKLGYPPKIGSRIWTPHKKENWVIVERKVADFKFWGEFHLILECERFQEDLVTGAGKVTQKNYQVNGGQLLG